MKLQISLSATTISKEERVVVNTDGTSWQTGTVKRSGPSSIRIELDSGESVTIPKIKFRKVRQILSTVAVSAKTLTEKQAEVLIEAHRQFLIASKYDYYNKTSDGVIYGQWMKKGDADLFLPHLPKDVDTSRVFELMYVEAVKTGSGAGSKLMQEFLNSEIIQSASVVILEPGGIGADSKALAERRMNFYKRFGFVGTQKLMWKI